MVKLQPNSPACLLAGVFGLEIDLSGSYEYTRAEEMVEQVYHRIRISNYIKQISLKSKFLLENIIQITF